jgi:hypothetical protein
MALRSISSVCPQQYGPCSAGFSQPEVLIGRPSRSLHICLLKWFCPLPEPGSNSGMPPHDQAVLNGTARGYAIVSRTRHQNPCRNHPAFVPGEPANGTRSRMAHSRPGSIRSLHLPASSLPARWLILDKCLAQSHSVVESETQDRAHFIGQLVGLDRPQSDEFIAPGYLYLLTTGGLLRVGPREITRSPSLAHWSQETASPYG